jgi:hypothetical protein
MLNTGWQGYRRNEANLWSLWMDLKAFDLERIDAELDQRGYVVVRDAEIRSLCPAARAEYERCMRTCEVHAPSDPFDFRALSNEPWRKLAIGSRNGLGQSYAQNLQSAYFDPDDKNYPALRSLFAIMLRVRNRLMRVPETFGRDPRGDRFWDACRIHHYPRGGGFMAMHKDVHFPKIIDAQIGKPFYQVSVLLSRKATDFVAGGGFVVSRENEKVDLETEAGFGAMVIFDGRTSHGVDDIDLDQVLDFSRSDGRLAAFVNLYSVL